MQLKSDQKLHVGLALATSSLLSNQFTTAQAAPANAPWDINAGLLIYTEQDDRVQDISFKSVASRQLNDDDEVSLGFQFDTLTGATPSGAISLEQPQTMTRPSGNDSYTVAPNQLPLDDTFIDTRAALNGSLSRALSTDASYTVGFGVSKEYDYLHLGVNASYARETNNNNTTLTAGLAVSADQIQAVGGTPEPFSLMRQVGVAAARNGDQDKTIVDGLISITQIISRRSLFQLNYSLSFAEGYLNDPYKVLTILDADSGEPLASMDDGLLQYRYESRPDSRIGHNVYAEFKYRFDTGIANLACRIHSDDWGLDSHTFEARYRWLLNDRLFIEPHLRYYTQSAADFYRAWLSAGDLPEHASSDYRLGSFSGVTLGILYNQKIGQGKSFGISAESYQTSGDDAQRSGPNGVTRTIDYADLTAWIVRLNYKFDW